MSVKSPISPIGDSVAIPFMVREPHHERDCLIGNSSIYPFAPSVNSGQALVEGLGTNSLQSLDRETLSRILPAVRERLLFFLLLFNLRTEKPFEKTFPGKLLDQAVIYRFAKVEIL
jgi:hypothetical protein